MCWVLSISLRHGYEHKHIDQILYVQPMVYNPYLTALFEKLYCIVDLL